MPGRSEMARKDIEETKTTDSEARQREPQKNKIEEYFGHQTLKTNPFGDNVSAEYGYRRAERIAAAVHLMTSHVENVEPLRNSLRGESLMLIDYALLLQGELRAAGSEHVRKMQASIRKLISLVQLAGISGRVSNQNARILVDALDDLGNFLTTSQRSSLAEAVPLTRDDLVPRTTLPPKREVFVDKKTAPPPQKKTIKDTVKDIDVRKESPSQSRSARILEILRTGGTLGIKDIVSNLPEYSEKMVQRDLASMTDSGQVRKIGEKRWSRYEIVR